jgi:hypothetical protein
MDTDISIWRKPGHFYFALTHTFFRVLNLVGSPATGDFDLDSAVDFLVVTKVEWSDSEVRLLQAHHVDIHALGSYPNQHLRFDLGVDWE